MSNRHLAKVEETIERIVENVPSKEYEITLELRKIPEIPIDDFATLKETLIIGDSAVRARFGSTSWTMFRIFSKPWDKIKLYILSLLTYGLPILGIILAIVFSWWYVLLLLSPVVTIPLTKRVYLKALFRYLAASEAVFCFLFSGGYIVLEVRGLGVFFKDM
jgi:hypothetical protein